MSDEVQDTRPCPSCYEPINHNATKCKHCSDYVGDRRFMGGTIWNWLGLAIIPLLLLGVSFLLTGLNEQRQNAIEAIRIQAYSTVEAHRANVNTLQAALDDISAILLALDLTNDSCDEDNIKHACASIRARIMATVAELDGERNTILITFLREAELLEWVFENTKLTNADLSSADLGNANLSNTDLSNAVLSNAILSNTILNNSALISADLSNTDLSNADLSNADLRGANLRGANLSSANLSSAKLSNTNLSGATLIGTHLSGADMREVNLSGATLIAADLRGVDLSRADMSRADLRDASLNTTNLREVDFRSADLSRADLRGASLRSADLSRTFLKNAMYDATTIWPKDFDPRTAGAMLVNKQGQLIEDNE